MSVKINFVSNLNYLTRFLNAYFPDDDITIEVYDKSEKIGMSIFPRFFFTKYGVFFGKKTHFKTTPYVDILLTTKDGSTLKSTHPLKDCQYTDDLKSLMENIKLCRYWITRKGEEK